MTGAGATVDGVDVGAHDVATTGVHGAGANTLLHSASAAGGDATGTLGALVITDDSHGHTSTTVTTHSTAHANDHAQAHDHSAAGDGQALVPNTINVAQWFATAGANVAVAAGDNFDINIGNSTLVRLTTAAGGFGTSGFTGTGTSGRYLLVFHNLAVAWTIKNEDASEATAARRINTLTNANVVLAAGASQGAAALFIYSGGLSRWVLVGTWTTPTPVTMSGTPDYITLSGQDIVRGLIDLATDVTGDLPYANLTPSAAISKLLGRGAAAGAGDWEEITLGTNLSMSGATLNATGGGGSVSKTWAMTT